MSDIFESGFQIWFTKHSLADEFVNWIMTRIGMVDAVALFDILRKAQRPVPEEWRSRSLKYGYARKDVRKLKPIKSDDGYLVILPAPKRIIPHPDGGSTTED